MKLAVFGSRTIKDDTAVFEIERAIQKYNADTIITAQEPLGVCTVAQQVAKKENLTLILEFLNFRYLQGAYEHRCDKILKQCDIALFIHDGESQGTKNELERAKKLNIKYEYVVLDKTDKEYKRLLDDKLEAFEIEKDELIDDLDFEIGDI